MGSFSERRLLLSSRVHEEDKKGLCLNRRVKPLKSSKPELLDWSISFSIVSPHIRGFKFRNAGSFCLWNPESGVVESGIRQSGIPLTIGI